MNLITMAAKDEATQSWHDLAVSPETVRRVGYLMVDSVVNHLLTSAQRPIVPPLADPAVLERSVGGEPPAAGRDPEELFIELDAYLSRYSANFLRSGIMAWVAATPQPLAGLLSGWLAATRFFPHSWKLTAGSTHIETTVVRWLGHLIGFSNDAAGTLTTGGSMANLYALCAARYQALGESGRRAGLAGGSQLTAYASEHAHMSLAQSMALMGIGEEHLRLIPLDAGYTMRVDALEDAIQADLAMGMKPFCVIGNAGTTNTGAVDDLGALADIAERHHLWFHVDGSYGALAALCSETAEVFRDLGRADSLALDPHKWMNIPFEAGCVLVKSWDTLAAAFSHVPAYLRGGDTPGEHDHWHHGFELSRADRAAKVWFEIQHHGVDAYRGMVASHLSLARRLARVIEEDLEFELANVPVLSVVCFRFIGGGVDSAEADRVNAAIEAGCLGLDSVLFSGTVLAGRTVLRICLINHRTTWSDVAAALEAARRLGRAAASVGGDHGTTLTRD